MQIKMVLKIASSTLMVVRHGILLYNIIQGDLPNCVDTVPDILATRDPQKAVDTVIDTWSEVCRKED
jgi:hypothetical protein